MSMRTFVTAEISSGMRRYVQGIIAGIHRVVSELRALTILTARCRGQIRPPVDPWKATTGSLATKAWTVRAT